MCSPMKYELFMYSEIKYERESRIVIRISLDLKN